METIIHGLGFLMMVVGGLSFVVMLVMDVIALFKGDKKGLTDDPTTSPWPIIIGKLPAKYLAPVFLFLVGFFLFDPVLFGKFWNQANGSA